MVGVWRSRYNALERPAKVNSLTLESRKQLERELIGAASLPPSVFSFKTPDAGYLCGLFGSSNDVFVHRYVVPVLNAALQCKIQIPTRQLTNAALAANSGRPQAAGARYNVSHACSCRNRDVCDCLSLLRDSGSPDLPAAAGSQPRNAGSLLQCAGYSERTRLDRR